MRAPSPSPLLIAAAGGTLLAVALVAIGLTGGRENGGRTVTALRQAQVIEEPGTAAPARRELRERSAPAVVSIRAAGRDADSGGAWLGLTAMTIDPALATAAGLQVAHGVLVQTVFADTPAARAGLRGGTVESQLDGQRIQLEGDVITSLDGRTVEGAEQLSAALAQRQAGERATLGILRGGTAHRVVVKLGRAP